MTSARGSGTLSHAIINREPEYGVTLHQMDEHLDTGPIVATKSYPLPEDKTAMAITSEVEDLGFDLLVETFGALVDGTYELIEQERLVHEAGIVPRFYTRRSVDARYRLEPGWEFEKLYRYLRALTVGKPKTPFFEDSGRKIYLSLTSADGHAPRTAPAPEPLLVAGLAARPDGRVLLVRRSAGDQHRPGVWELPHSTPRHGETLREAVRRSVLDICGFEVAVHGSLAVADELTAGARAMSERRVMVAFSAPAPPHRCRSCPVPGTTGSPGYRGSRSPATTSTR